MRKVDEKLTDIELYCLAKTFQSVIFADKLFHGCTYCKYQKECMPDKKVHSNMIFDRVRKKLQHITAVDLSQLDHKDKFSDTNLVECF